MQRWRKATSVPHLASSAARTAPTEATFDSLAAIQERHPTNGWMTHMEDLPKVTQTVPFQVSAREVETPIRSFPAGSARGPDRLRPQHLLDLINNRESAGTLYSKSRQIS